MDGLGSGRELVVKPRRRGYVHRPIVAVRDGAGMTEHGEIVTDLPVLAMTHPHVWITHDPTHLLNIMLEAYGESLRFQFTDTEDPDVEMSMSAARLINFGFERGKTKYGNQARHTVWHPARMFSAPRVAVDLIGGDFSELIRFATDVREWCKDNNLPLRSTLPGIASSLARDERFWPTPRGRVPRATNERIRAYLPGVYQESRAPVIQTIPAAIALDQVRAYHRAAQEVPSPHPTYIYARGYFDDPERFNDSDSSPELWAPRGSTVYERTITQPGLVAVVATSRPIRKGEWRPPVCESRERKVRYVWTNELPLCEHHGLQVEGIVAAWTSEVPDEGLPRYGRWAEGQIDEASDYRRQWLKPTLHSVYGLFAARPRDLLIGHSHAAGGVETQYLVRGYAYNVKEIRIQNQQPVTVNVAALGVLQSAIRARTLELANIYGDDVLHVHADGLHLHAVQLEFPPNGWSAEPVTNLYYIDNVSWLSEQRDVLPGRDQWQRQELQRRAHAINH